MRTYIGITGLVFAAIFAAHMARIWAEGTALLSEPFFILSTGLALGFSIWAVILSSRRPLP